MRTAKEMLVISNTANPDLSNELTYEREVIQLINNEALIGGTSIYVGSMLHEDLRSRLKSYGYDVSEPMYENEEGSEYESCVSWGDES